VGTEITVVHLTRMREDRICVAGITGDGDQLRPVLDGPWRRSHLAPGGPLEVGAVVDLGPTAPRPQPPEVEDALVLRPSAVTSRGRLTDAAFWSLVSRHARPTLREIFGPDLRPSGRAGAGVPRGSGSASLGCLRPDWARLEVRADPDGGRCLRVHLYDPDLRDLDLSLTDVRLHDTGNQPVDPLVRAAQNRLRAGEEVILAVGLTRAYVSRDGTASLHWLQVNNLHFRDYFDDHPSHAPHRPR
jgi:hypothetical protein